MLEKEQWKEGDKVYGLPKIKTVRIKIKKEKAEKVETTAEGTAPVAAEAVKEQTPGKQAQAKPAGKETAAKQQEKK